MNSLENGDQVIITPPPPKGGNEGGRWFHPIWLILICLVAGLAVAGPMFGGILIRRGYRKAGWISGTLLCILGIAIIALGILWGVEWYWTSLALTLLNIICGSILYLYLIIHQTTLEKISSVDVASLKNDSGTYRCVIAGTVAGMLISVLIGTILMVFYTLAFDRFFSTLLPMAFDDFFAGAKCGVGVLFLTLAGGIAGGFFGRYEPAMSAQKMFLYGFALAWVYLSWLMALELISIPGFQATAATGTSFRLLLILILCLNVFIGIWWSVFFLFYMLSPSRLIGKLFRVVQIAGINLAAGMTIAIIIGYPADMFLSLGTYFERAALTSKALWCYEQGLKRKPEYRIASWLQYRAALLNHKLGNRQKAIYGFKRVVAKYTSSPRLIKNASRFLDSLERNPDGKRVVLPGVETRTEHKGGYCVPNSLALVMQYWGSEVTAKSIGSRITGLGSGTYIVDQTWFAVQEGFRHDFLPLASLNDIRDCIDAGLPVLVYVPSHVFAIVGYDEALETFVTYDVATWDVWTDYIQKDFIKSWKRRNTTLVLVYPPEKASLIPSHIQHRLSRLSDDFLHFQLYFFDAPTDSTDVQINNFTL